MIFQIYEYKVLGWNTTKMLRVEVCKKLNELGADRWELVVKSKRTWIFKREVLLNVAEASLI